MNLRKQKGYSLIELMVAMTLGIFVVGGAIFAFDEARATLNTNATLALMQENARWAFHVIEPDVRLAGYWGRHTSGSSINGRATGPNPLNVNVDGDCGADWSIDVVTSLEASNNVDPELDCISASDYATGTDTLQIRHASSRVIATGELAAEPGRIFVRTHESGLGSLFVGNAEPAIADGQNNALLAHAYYVRPYSIGDDGTFDENNPVASMPSLRRQGLTVVAGNPSIVDQEVIAGIEDMQIQFGIDTTGNGSVNRYVNPDNTVLDGNPSILATRVWLRVRADTPELGFTDTRTYNYADQSYTPNGEEARYRRLLVSRTIFLRNEAIVEGGMQGL